jgi:anthranilate phosphoribosyltransferase
MLSAALALLGSRRAVVVCGEDGLDEVTLGGSTFVSEVTPNGTTEYTWAPEQFGLTSGDTAALRVDGPEASAEVVRSVLDGKHGPQRDVVVLNAAAALWTAGRSDSLSECAGLAAEAIDRGVAKRTLANLVEASQS